MVNMTAHSVRPLVSRRFVAILPLWFSLVLPSFRFVPVDALGFPPLPHVWRSCCYDRRFLFFVRALALRFAFTFLIEAFYGLCYAHAVSLAVEAVVSPFRGSLVRTGLTVSGVKCSIGLFRSRVVFAVSLVWLCLASDL